MASFDLRHGDCLDVMPTIVPHSVDMLFADFPYAVTRCKWDLLVPQQQFWSAAKSLLTSGACVVATADLRLAGELMRACPVPYRYDLVLHKSRPVGFLNSKRMPLRAHEIVLYFSNKGAAYNVQMQKSWRQRPPSSFTRQKKTDCYGKAEHQVTYEYGPTRYPTSVLEPFSPASERGLHPTQKPLALLEWLIATYTNPGDLVLDPVMGSGTTGHACAKLGRRFLGIEKDPTYFAVAEKRVMLAYAENEAGKAV